MVMEESDSRRCRDRRILTALHHPASFACREFFADDCHGWRKCWQCMEQLPAPGWSYLSGMAGAHLVMDGARAAPHHLHPADPLPVFTVYVPCHDPIPIPT